MNSILQDVMEYSKNDTSLILEIFKMYIYDMLFLNDDRHPSNWGLVRENNKLKLIIFDNQNIFSVIYPPFIRFNEDLFLSRSVIFINKLYQDLEQFLDYCPLEYKDYLCDLILKVDIKSIAKVFLDIEIEYGRVIDPKYLRIYREHYCKIEEIVKRKRGVNNAR